MSPAISVVISTYERPTALARVLEGYTLQTFRDFEVVVADDGSGPETKAVCDKYASRIPGFVYARHEHEGFRAAAARNMGVRASSGDWIVFADGDCVPFPDYLAAHARARDERSFLTGERFLLEEDEAALVTVAAVASRSAFENAPSRERKRLKSLARKNAFYRFTGLKPERPKLLTSNCSLSRKAFEQVNGLDEKFRGWGREDDDLRRRLVKTGLAPRSVVQHANVLHLWHPPVASFKGTVRAGPNEPYFQRGFFLSRCRHGLVERPLSDVKVASNHSAFPSVASGPVEVEVLVDEGTGAAPQFQRDAEVRVLLAKDPAAPRPKGAHLVLPLDLEQARRTLDETL